eukprot:3563311-Prymnesium_polylepis.1
MHLAPPGGGDGPDPEVGLHALEVLQLSFASSSSHLHVVGRAAQQARPSAAVHVAPQVDDGAGKSSEKQ